MLKLNLFLYSILFFNFFKIKIINCEISNINDSDSDNIKLSIVKYFTKKEQIKLMDNDYIVLHIGRDPKPYKFKIDFSESKLIMFHNSVILLSSTVEYIQSSSNYIKDYLYIGNSIIKYPIYIDYELKYYENNKLDIEYDELIKHKIYDGVIGFGLYSEIWKYWNILTVNKYYVFLDYYNHNLEYNNIDLNYNILNNELIINNNIKCLLYDEIDKEYNIINIFYNFNQYETNIYNNNCENKFWKLDIKDDKMDELSKIYFDNEIIKLSNNLEIETIKCIKYDDQLHHNNDDEIIYENINNNTLIVLGNKKMKEMIKLIDRNNELFHLGIDISKLDENNEVINIFIVINTIILILWFLISIYDSKINVYIFYGISILFEIVLYFNSIIMIVVAITYLKHNLLIEPILQINNVTVLTFVLINTMLTLIIYFIVIYIKLILKFNNTQNVIEKNYQSHNCNIIYLNDRKIFRLVNMIGNNLLLLWYLSLAIDNSTFNTFYSVLIIYSLCFISTILLLYDFYLIKSDLIIYELVLTIFYYLIFAFFQLKELFFNNVQQLDFKFYFHFIFIVLEFVFIFFPAFLLFIQIKLKIDSIEIKN